MLVGKLEIFQESHLSKINDNYSSRSIYLSILSCQTSALNVVRIDNHVKSKNIV